MNKSIFPNCPISTLGASLIESVEKFPYWLKHIISWFILFTSVFCITSIIQSNWISYEDSHIVLFCLLASINNGWTSVQSRKSPLVKSWTLIPSEMSHYFVVRHNGHLIIDLVEIWRIESMIIILPILFLTSIKITSI